jgi:hypothetical protein
VFDAVIVQVDELAHAYLYCSYEWDFVVDDILHLLFEIYHLE